jgi:hypothetical protein
VHLAVRPHKQHVRAAAAGVGLARVASIDLMLTMLLLCGAPSVSALAESCVIDILQGRAACGVGSVLLFAFKGAGRGGFGGGGRGESFAALPLVSLHPAGPWFLAPIGGSYPNDEVATVTTR